MRTRNPNYDRAVDTALGRVAAGKSASAGIHVSDNLSAEVILAIRQNFVGADVQDMDNGVVRITIKGNGGSFTNGGGSPALAYGDVVVIQTDGTITTTTTQQDTRPAGVVQQSTDAGAVAPIIFSGYVAQVNTTGTVNSGDYLETSTTSGKAEGNATRRVGSFAKALAAGPNPPALMFGITDAAGSATSGVFELNISGGQSVIKAHGSMGSTETFDPTDGNVHTGTLDANCTFTLTAPTGTGAATLELYLTQDGTGSRTVTWPGSVVWPGGTAPTLSTAAGSVDRVVLETLDGGTTWYGVMVGGASSSALTYVPMTVYNGANWLPLVDGSGNQIMAHV